MRDSHKAIAAKRTQARFTGLAILAALSFHAVPAAANPDADASKLEIVTTALGMEQLTQYSANRNAVGIGWAKHFGMEASYFNVGDSKFAKHRANDDDVGGRVNVKMALDISTPLNEHSRLYSRVGMYVWELDLNYNRTSNRLDVSRESNSGMVGVGAMYGEDWLRMGIELEQVNAVSFDDPRDQHRVLFNVFSKF